MKKNLRFILLAAFACCLTTAFADAVDTNYEKDNTFYGTTPYIELANMPDLGACMLFSVLQTNADFQNDMKLAQQEYQEKTATRVRPLSAANKSTNAQVYAIDGCPVDGQTHGIIISDGQKYIQ